MSEKFGEKVEKFLAFGGKLLVYEPIYAPEGVNTVFPDFLRAIIEKLGLFLQAIFGNFYLKWKIAPIWFLISIVAKVVEGYFEIC